MPRQTLWIALSALFGLVLSGASATAQKNDQAEALLQRADEITKSVSKIRGLKLKRPIKRGVMNKAQLRERLLARIAQEYTDDEILGEGLAMKRFGLLGKDVDFLETVTKLLTDEIAGFYDPFSEELFLAGWATGGGDVLLAHEIDHALQDQHFDLRRFMGGDKKNADATAARQAVVEGDGTVLMMEHMLAGLGRSAPWAEEGFADNAANMTAAQAGSIKGATFALREALIFPYAEGLRFIAHFRRHHSWKRIDKMFSKPPLSTEQILHPELYEAYEPPIVVTATTPAIISQYKLAYQNVSGEKGLSVLLEAHGVGRERAEEAAAGWGGDRLALYIPPGRSKKDGLGGTIGILRTRWDQEADAIEFFAALSHALPKLAEEGPQIAGGTSALLRYKSPDGSIVSASRTAASVTLLIGAPPAREPDLRAQVESW